MAAGPARFTNFYPEHTTIDYGTRKCSYCNRPFTIKNAVQRTATRAYCENEICQIYKDRKLWKIPREKAEAILQRYRDKLENGGKLVPRWKTSLTRAAG